MSVYGARSAKCTATPADLPAEMGARGRAQGRKRMRRIVDYIAGMTDRYALVEHARHFPALWLPQWNN